MNGSVAPMKKPLLCIVTPALADANNGNWQTARRWARMLSGHYQVRLSMGWPDPAIPDHAVGLIALHARRSAASIEAWAVAHPDRALVVALTGTDLYRDIASDPQAQRSLQRAQRLLVLQEQGPLALPPALRERCRVVFQSTAARHPLPKTRAHLRAVMVGHLRDEKWPQTLFEAVRLIAPDEGIRVDHIGAALDPALGEAARATAQTCPHYRWLGALPHAATLARIQRAHVLVHTSRMEGGAHAVLEAVRSGTPVLASRIAGNVGMLGDGYRGYFEPGDTAGLAALLRDCRRGIDSPGGRLADLAAQCALRAPLFDPRREQAALLGVLAELLAPALPAAIPAPEITP